jgi:hypothetical protein
MSGKLTQPLENYAQAFEAYLDVSNGHFLIKTNGIFLTYYEEMTYRVCHYDDLVWLLRSYFSGSYTLIYTETSFGLWFYLFDHYKDISDEDQIIDFYKAWKIYWEDEAKFFGKEDGFHIVKQHGWEDFELFLARIKAEPDAIVKSAIEIAGVHLIPVIALAMRMRFPDEEVFYRLCVDLLIEGYPHDFGILGELEGISVDFGDSGYQPYFIGESEFNFHAYKELGEDF